MLGLFKGFGKLRAPRDTSAPPLSQEHNYGRRGSGPSGDKLAFSESPASCMVALLPASLLQTSFQPVPPHCTVTGALQSPVAIVLQHLDLLEAAVRQNPAKLWSLTAQRLLWACWKVLKVFSHWNIFEEVVMSKALIPNVTWEKISLPQNFLVKWTDGSVSQAINLFPLFSHWFG